MALNFPITFSLAPLPTGLALDADDFAQAIVANLQATISGDFLTGQIGGNAPTQNIGPWANNGQWYFWDASTGAYVQQTFASFQLPSGLIFPYGGLVPPAGFLLCNGALVSRSVYSNLFAVIGTNFGAGSVIGPGDGSTTFALPNLQGRIPLGYGASGLGNVYTIGQLFGEELHVLSVTELAIHTHTQNAHSHQLTIIDTGHGHAGTFENHSHGLPDHDHTVSGNTLTNIGGVFTSGGAANFVTAGTLTTSTSIPALTSTTGVNDNAFGLGIIGNTTGITNYNGAGGNVAIAQTAVNQNQGMSAGHNTVPPVVATSFVIKT